MIAKLIVHGKTRETARAASAHALGNAVIWPLRSNAGFLTHALEHPALVAGTVDTGLIAREGEALLPPALPGDNALARAAASIVRWEPLAGFRLNAATRLSGTLLVGGTAISIDFADVDV